jgi:thiol-disulfide isomerase/thioredoxin
LYQSRFWTDKPKQYYEHTNPRLILNADQLVSFAVLDWEKTTPLYRKDEYVYDSPSPIVNIPGEEFDKTISDGQRYFVMFFGMKCGACKQFLPTYERFAQAALDRNSDWVVARMEGFSNMQVVDRYTARPWPSLVL